MHLVHEMRPIATDVARSVVCVSVCALVTLISWESLLWYMQQYELFNPSITRLPQPTAMLPTGRYHITSPLKNPPSCDAVFRQNSLTTLLLVVVNFAASFPHLVTSRVTV